MVLKRLNWPDGLLKTRAPRPRFFPITLLYQLGRKLSSLPELTILLTIGIALLHLRIQTIRLWILLSVRKARQPTRVHRLFSTKEMPFRARDLI